MRTVQMLALASLVLAGCSDHPLGPDETSDLMTPTLAKGIPGPPVDPGPAPGMGHGPPAPVVIDFETPDLDGRKLPGDEFVDPVTGTRFTPIQLAPWNDFVVGVTPNSGTSACVPGDLSDQTLGTGRAGSLGYSAVPIRADFARPLMKGSVVSVEFQALVGAPLRLTLLGMTGEVLTVVDGTVTAGVGACSMPGGDRGWLTLAATADDWVAAAIVEQLSNKVYVIDDLTIDPRRGPK